MKIRQRQKSRHLPRKRKTDREWNRYYRNLLRQLKPGKLFETCGCDVARVLYTIPEKDELAYESLTRHGFTGLPARGYCSLIHCVPTPLTRGEVNRRMEIFKSGGKVGLSMRYYTEECKMSEEESAEMIKTWESES
jgi:hypothetical protein